MFHKSYLTPELQRDSGELVSTYYTIEIKLHRPHGMSSCQHVIRHQAIVHNNTWTITVTTRYPSPWQHVTHYHDNTWHVTMTTCDMSPWHHVTCHHDTTWHVTMTPRDMSPWQHVTCHHDNMSRHTILCSSTGQKFLIVRTKIIQCNIKFKRPLAKVSSALYITHVIHDTDYHV